MPYPEDFAIDFCQSHTQGQVISSKGLLDNSVGIYALQQQNSLILDLYIRTSQCNFVNGIQATPKLTSQISLEEIYSRLIHRHRCL